MAAAQKRQPSGVRHQRRAAIQTQETYKALFVVFVCCGLAVLTLVQAIPKVSAQCAIRKNLPIYEPAVASRVWNVSQVQEYRLPSALYGQYSYIMLQSSTRHEDGQLDRKALLKNLDLNKMQLHNASLYVTWNCTVSSENINAASRVLKVDSMREHGQYLVADISQHKALWSNPSHFPIRCRLQPVFSPYYMLAYADYVASKRQFTQQEFDTLYPGTRFPWAPCASGYYTDNEVLIVGPYADSVQETQKLAAAKSVTTLQFRSLQRAVPIYEKQLWKTVSSKSGAGSSTSTSTQSVTLPCENLAMARDGDAASFTRYLIQNYATNMDGNDDDVTKNLTRFTGEWGVNTRRSIVLDASEDRCLSELSRRVFEIRDSESANRWQFLFTDANDSPAINNHYQNIIPEREQCFKNAQQAALHDMNTPWGRGNVRHTHSCYSYAPEIGLPPAQYSWSYKTSTKAYQVTPRCVNHGIFTHKWTADACGQRAMSIRNVYVEDTMAPVIDRSSKLVTWAKGKTAVALQCHWPAETTRFCIREKIVAAVRQIYTDNCDSSNDLVITPKWAEGGWYTCSKKTTGNQLTGCSPADGSAFQLVSLKDGTQDMCFSKSDLSTSSKTVMRYVVQVDVSDSCGNISQNENRILYSLAFVDHLRKDMSQIKLDLCTSIV